MRKNKKNILAFDIGGTKIASGIIELGENDYKIYDYQKIKTPKSRDEIIQKLIELVIYYQRDNGFEGIRIGIAGQIDYKKDIIVYSPNIKELKNLNFKKIIKEKTKKDVEIENDVKCFALAENKFGKSRSYKNAVYLAIGTGIGGAIKIDNKLYRGANNIAGEFGHMVVVFDGEKCECGNRGCWEQYVSGKAIEKLYFKTFDKKKSAKDIAADSVKGINQDREVIKKSALHLSVGLANIINVINPEIIIVGGSVVKQKEILDLARKEALKEVLVSGRKTKIIRSDLEDEAVLVGAALL
jgi:glucokinase